MKIFERVWKHLLLSKNTEFLKFLEEMLRLCSNVTCVNESQILLRLGNIWIRVIIVHSSVQAPFFFVVSFQQMTQASIISVASKQYNLLSNNTALKICIQLKT